MTYVQFYHYIANGSLMEASGDRSVVILDGRCSKQWMGDISASECKHRGYDAWCLFKGESFTRSAPISQVWYVAKDEPVRNPVWLSAHAM